MLFHCFAYAKKSEQFELPECLHSMGNWRIAAGTMQLYRSISFGGRYYKLFLVGYELFEVPTQLYALNEKANGNNLPNDVIMIAIALISINMMLTPMLLYVDASVLKLLTVDAILDTCVFVLNTAIIGASPKDILTDISIWLPAVSLSGTILVAFQPRGLDGIGIEWANNPSTNVSCNAVGDASEEGPVERNEEDGEHENTQWTEDSSRMSADAGKEHEAASMRRRSLGTMIEISVRKAVGGRTQQGVAVVTSACLGVLLFTSMLIRSSVRYHACIAEHGEGWTCSEPQAHFKNGLFGPTSCAIEEVLALSCGGKQFSKLPKMTLFKNITTINVFGNKNWLLCLTKFSMF